MNDNQLITKESEWIAYFTSSIERIIAKMERMKTVSYTHLTLPTT